MKSFKMVKNKLGLITILVVLLLSSITISAQVAKGVIKNEFGVPVQGVSVNTAKGTSGTISDNEGVFSLKVQDGSTFLVFSHLNYTNEKKPIDINQDMIVTLKYDRHNKDQVIDMGLYSQKRSDITGAVSIVLGEELEKTPTYSLQQTLEGRLPGLMTWENSLNASNQPNMGLYLRGGNNTPANAQPKIMIDGMLYSRSNWDDIQASEIESITLLKDASTLTLYGISGASGILSIRTKRGNKGKLAVKVNVNTSMKDYTLKPLFVNSANYAKLRNQAAYNVNPSGGQYQRYSQTQVNGYESGQNRDSFPNNNWYDMYMKPQVYTQNVSTSVRGGNDIVQGFSTINFNRQGAVFNTDGKNNPEGMQHSGNQSYVQVNFRTNLDITISKQLSSYVRVAGGVINQALPFTGNTYSGIYSSLFNMPSMVYGPLTPMSLLGDSSSNQVVVTSYNKNPTYGQLNRTGYQSSSFNRTSAQTGLVLDLESITQGLKAEGAFGYQSIAQSTLRTSTTYQRWIQSDPNLLTFTRDGNVDNTQFVYGKSDRQFSYDLNYGGKLTYAHTFDKNTIESMAYANYQRYNSSWDEQPNTRILSGVNLSYNFDNRYLAKFDLGYTGSDKFPAGNRFHATPSIALGWTLSNEKFMNELKWLLSDFKLRASYGIKADDNFGSRNPYSDDVSLKGRITFPAVADLNLGYGGVSIGKFGNLVLEPEKIEVQNYGVNIGLLNSLTISFDYFKDKSNNLFISDLYAYPSYGGFASSVSNKNTGSFERSGYELVLNYKKQISKDLGVSLGGMYNYSDNTNIYTGEVPRTEGENASAYFSPYTSQGYATGQQFGYRVDYTSGSPYFTQDEITHLNLDYSAIGSPIAGCLKYKDLNNDGKIDIKDQDVISTGGLPKVYYGFNGEVTIRNFELSFLFQGVANYTSLFSGAGIYDPAGEGTYSSWHINAWTPERFSQNPASITYPVLMEGSSSNRQPSDFFVFDRSYLRLKNLILSYTLQKTVVKYIGAESCKISLSGMNLLSFYSMKVANLDPENGGYTKIPPSRVFNVGVSLNF